MNDGKESIINLLTENLPLLRKKMKMTQEELANQIGISRHSIIAIETSKKSMGWNTCLAIIAVFSKDEDTKNLMDILGITGGDFYDLIDLNQ